ncbi:glycoside hydrolase family 15 protein [Pontibacter silvestris]|uniref:Glycoside hydrolase family 15 protein n=1 Tax=Pontibacter silvestris TaxID=2305183 RepID=A0ABW4WSY6_9BACT|nr:glycoside hydrolase family 15 protein [Pontibacter silvestris]MCC9137705.1 glycoside hydrolase family 15 protein [Pontibacter silvestris]
MEDKTIPLRDLAIIGDRRTCAYVSKNGSIIWYCPRRFDYPSVFASLLDLVKGGSWKVLSKTLVFAEREYVSDSTVLKTHFTGSAGKLMIEDWMPMGAAFTGICRTLSVAPESTVLRLTPKPDYARSEVNLVQKNNVISINGQQFLYASHPISIKDNTIECNVPEGEASWFVLSDIQLEMTQEVIEQAKQQTQKHWEEVSGHIKYHGPYEMEVRNSLRVLRLMTCAENGGIIAAGTTSLPEVLGGDRNYDYRYVWLRDASMIVSALTRAGSDGVEERKLLDFICGAMHEVDEPVVPFFTLGFTPAPGEEIINLAGYANSKPVRIGNDANNQLQLDAISNVLLAAKLIYSTYDTREHWGVISRLADFLALHWHKPDHGLWEETEQKHYTSSKVVAAVSLEFISQQTDDKAQKERWLNAAKAIRDYVHKNCLTKDGAYAAYAGAEFVDVSAMLFPTWAYTAADAPEMLKTIAVLERDYCQNNLFRRHLLEHGSSREGAFLAGTFWVAQYWVMRRDWDKFGKVMQAALRFMNDVGLMPEEGDPETGAYLGNIPQTFVHASLIGAVIDYKNARQQEKDKK